MDLLRSKRLMILLSLTILMIIVQVILKTHHMPIPFVGGRGKTSSEELIKSVEGEHPTVSVRTDVRTGSKRSDSFSNTLRGEKATGDQEQLEDEESRDEIENLITDEGEMCEIVEKELEGGDSTGESQKQEGTCVWEARCTVTVNGVEYELKPGDVIQVVVEEPGTMNPRKMTPEELRRYSELGDELERVKPGSPRHREIIEEIRRINAETQYPSYHIETFGFEAGVVPE
jgi:quercetin dioxygenase-like cupin family protein